MTYIPYARQHINEDDIQAVIQTLKSLWLTQGPAVEEFEKKVAEYCGVKYAVAVNSGTSALHIACMAADLGVGDILWTSPNTFVASANCGLYCGAHVNFSDIELQTYTMDVQKLAINLAKAKTENTLPKVVIPVDFAGQPCALDEIGQLAKEYSFTVIEDASHALGATYKGSKIGDCSFADMTVLSFHPVKIITTAEGGMVLTNRQELYEKLILRRSHGITRNPKLMEEKSHGPWYYEQVGLGYNYRLTDLQAALGVSQMKRVDEFVTRRHEIAARYDEKLKFLPVICPWQATDRWSALHLYVIRLKLEEMAKSHRQVFEELRQAGIMVNLHYIPVHTQPFYRKLGFKWGDFPEAEEYYGSAISLPIYYGLTDEEQDFVVEKLAEVLA